MNRETPLSELTGLLVVAARARGICEVCGQARATVWHPRKDPAPADVGMTGDKSQGNSWDPANGLYLCRQCDHKITDNPVDAYYLVGWRVKHDQDPAKVRVVIRHNAADSDLYLLTSQGEYIPAYPESARERDLQRRSEGKLTHVPA